MRSMSWLSSVGGVEAAAAVAVADQVMAQGAEVAVEGRMSGAA
jgi:hypothetical protein